MSVIFQFFGCRSDFVEIGDVGSTPKLISSGRVLAPSRFRFGQVGHSGRSGMYDMFHDAGPMWEFNIGLTCQLLV